MDEGFVPQDEILWGDCLKVIEKLPSASIDLLVTDPPYNMTKIYSERAFSKTTAETYEEWLRAWIGPLRRILKPTASLYVCTEWQSSGSVERVLREYFTIRNRITWEREKGRGAKSNWKNASEDIWYCTVSKDYDFNLDAVRLRRKVIAPYRDSDGTPRDWKQKGTEKFRDTAPSNLWTDISVPFWSMPENTDHPTQKPEKLIAKLILASSQKGDLIFDPFLGSGTTAVVAKKLGRHYCGAEREHEYCLLSQKRLDLVRDAPSIQGFRDGCFWDRNSGRS
jgi:site-specific DNA-methyltransferase (adenine-specific)